MVEAAAVATSRVDDETVEAEAAVAVAASVMTCYKPPVAAVMVERARDVVRPRLRRRVDKAGVTSLLSRDITTVGCFFFADAVAVHPRVTAGLVKRSCIGKGVRGLIPYDEHVRAVTRRHECRCAFRLCVRAVARGGGSSSGEVGGVAFAGCSYCTRHRLELPLTAVQSAPRLLRFPRLLKLFVVPSALLQSFSRSRPPRDNTHTRPKENRARESSARHTSARKAR